MAVLIFNKFRQINRFMQKTFAEPVDFDDVADVLSNLLECNAYFISRSGKIIGYKLMDNILCDVISSQEKDGFKISKDCNEQLWKINEPTVKENMDCIFFSNDCPIKYLAIIPAYGAGARMGTLILGRLEKDFDEGEIAIGEYGATIVALETMISKSEKERTVFRKQAEARVALGTLSYFEREVVHALYDIFEGDEKVIVTSEITDKLGISRSIFVNILSKLRSAGMLESRSLGMKGMYIKILNDSFLEELKNL